MNLPTSIPNGELVIIISTKLRFLNSIRTKLFVSLVAIGVVPLLLLSMSIISSVQSYEKTDMRTKMLRQANTISTNLSVMNYFDYGSGYTFLENIQAVIENRFLIINDVGEVTYDTNHFDEGKLIVAPQVIDVIKGNSTHIIEDNGRDIIVYTPIYSEDYESVLGVTMLVSDYDDIIASGQRMMNIAFLLIGGITLIIIILTFYFSGSLTKPFSQFISHLNRVSEGHIDERADIKGNYEIEEIGDAFNEMLEKIQEIDNSRQQFVANVSHELKTPLSSMKVLAESLLSMDNAPEEFYREFMEDINSEIDRETKIINDLLTLVTLDKTESKLNLTGVNVNELIEQVMRMLKPVSEKKRITLEIKSFREVIASIDETKMYLVFMNLIENGIKYNKPDGKVTVSINSDHRDMTIKVMDTGIGIPHDQLDRIFERFYRVDKNRSRDTGGTGLGLSIVHKTVLMHGGSIRCHSSGEHGTTFTLRIPLSQPLELE